MIPCYINTYDFNESCGNPPAQSRTLFHLPSACFLFCIIGVLPALVISSMTVQVQVEIYADVF